jgi:nickel/cobalt exporter
VRLGRKEDPVDSSLALGLGFFLGVRHATDADHVAAVATMLRREGGLPGALRVGALWGLGHSATVVGVGVAIVAFRCEVSAHARCGMELAVAAMLCGLGAANLVALARRGRAGAGGGHRHGLAPADLRPVAVGLVHGLAGSAGVTLLALATIRDAAGAVAYLALFGVGTIAGMALLTALLALPLALAARRSGRLQAGLVVAASVASLATGCVVAVRALRP